jgi:hypothetical protein
LYLEATAAGIPKADAKSTKEFKIKEILNQL